MNHVCLMGRLTADPEIKNTENTTVARYTIAVDRYGKKDEADFIRCVCFGKTADFAEKYLHKGIKVAVEGRIQTGSYEKDGKKVYTTDVIVNTHYFCESKKAADAPAPNTPDDFMNITGDVDDDVPWN